MLGGTERLPRTPVRIFVREPTPPAEDGSEAPPAAFGSEDPPAEDGSAAAGSRADATPRRSSAADTHTECLSPAAGERSDAAGELSETLMSAVSCARLEMWTESTRSAVEGEPTRVEVCTSMCMCHDACRGRADAR